MTQITFSPPTSVPSYGRHRASAPRPTQTLPRPEPVGPQARPARAPSLGLLELGVGGSRPAAIPQKRRPSGRRLPHVGEPFAVGADAGIGFGGVDAERRVAAVPIHADYEEPTRAGVTDDSDGEVVAGVGRGDELVCVHVDQSTSWSVDTSTVFSEEFRENVRYLRDGSQ